MSFENKVVVVTGSTSGIGATTAKLFAKEGAHVVIVGKYEANFKSVSEDCEKFGNKPLIIKADVSNDADGRRIIDETLKRHGKIDVLINNAGIAEINDITNENFMEDYDRIISVNLRGVVLITHSAIPHLIKSKGNIINISSVAGLSIMNDSGFIPYCVSKAGIAHFTRCLALKLAQFSIRVNAVSPGPVRTNILDHPSLKSVTFEQLSDSTALKRVSEPMEIADLILFLASDKARGITGSNFVLDNGFLL